jgi:hypothetical protein
VAWITSVELKDGTGKIQPTNLIAHAKVFQTDGQTTVLQLDTYGSADRKLLNKQSQTLQFGRDAAKQLYEILRTTYNFER